MEVLEVLQGHLILVTQPLHVLRGCVEIGIGDERIAPDVLQQTNGGSRLFHGSEQGVRETGLALGGNAPRSVYAITRGGVLLLEVEVGHLEITNLVERVA
jgi:hypothetical protein